MPIRCVDYANLYGQDITERKVAEDAEKDLAQIREQQRERLQESESRLRQIVEKNVDGLVVVDAEGQFGPTPVGPSRHLNITVDHAAAQRAHNLLNKNRSLFGTDRVFHAIADDPQKQDTSVPEDRVQEQNPVVAADSHSSRSDDWKRFNK